MVGRITPLHPPPTPPPRADDPGPGTCVSASGGRDPVAVVQVRIVSWAASGPTSSQGRRVTDGHLQGSREGGM